VTQPLAAPDPTTAAPSTSDGSDGSPSNTPGSPGGNPFSVGGPGIPDGDGDGPPPPPKPVAPRAVSEATLDALRIAGDARPPLPASVKVDLMNKHERQVTAAVRLCLDTSGNPSTIDLQKSTGYPAADDTILRAMSGWRYRPYELGGEAVPVCTAVVFVYIMDK
jgi:TonB family protein